jgi:hypothetical protein
MTTDRPFDKTQDRLLWQADWTVYKHLAGCPEPYEIYHIPGNLALNEGIAVVAGLITDIGAETAFSNAAAYLGVGDSTDVAVATQTGLQAATNKLYKAMDATYPQISSQTIIWRSTFTTAEANFDWREVTVANGNSDSADNLNRKVSTIGTKTSSMEWVLELRILIA